MSGYATLAGTALAPVVIFAPRQGRGRAKVLVTLALLVTGFLSLLIGDTPAVLLFAVTSLAGGLLLLTEMTFASRTALGAAWISCGALIGVLNLFHGEVARWIAAERLWLVTAAFLAAVVLWGLARRTALTAQDRYGGMGV
ncbi:hypothetical protein [Streptomyces sp. NBC_00859]|uniref:hypothetical protein n=1 Tax=Streptomyces sp. NBC_00859 TaxID=2903682 RepID=UPI00386486E4|nr:hypothetical protein OG584_18610 [Streptomyces sp. NBC_00859]